MRYIHNFPFNLYELLQFALEKLDKGELFLALKIADQAYRLSDPPDVNALMVRATVLSELGNLPEAIIDLKTAHLMMPSNYTIATSLLRACQSDLQNHQATFNKVLTWLFRKFPSLSFTPEILSWLTLTDIPFIGAAWCQDDDVVGWAVNKKDVNAPLQIELDGSFFTAETELATPLLAQAGLGNGYNGFRLKLPHTYQALRLGIGGSGLWGCPFINNQPRPPQAPVTSISKTVDIIVPVYAGRSDTLACLDAIKISTNHTPSRVVVINDASPDSLLVSALKERAQRKEITLISRPINAGFSGAVNTALHLDTSRDIILLNADTLVFGDWLDRLHTAAYHSDSIGTVTPLSNHGELVSYPNAMQNNPVFDIKAAKLIDELFNALEPQTPIKIPVGVGFCLYIKRQALNAVGFFDEATFGRGYGEDTDFGLRIIQAGYSNVCAVNTYVIHWGSRSFGNEKNYLVEQNLPHLYRRYPLHAKEYEQFLSDKVLDDLFRKLQRQLLKNLIPSFNATLIMGALKASQPTTFNLKPIEKQPDEWLLRLTISGITGLDTINYHWPEQASELREDILAAAFKSLTFTSLGEWPLEIMDQLCDGFIPYQFHLEDYSGYCPRKYRLIDNAMLCKDPLDDNTCTRCIKELGPLVYGYSDIASWHARTEHLFTNASKISALTPEIAKSYNKRFTFLTNRKLFNTSTIKSPVLKLPKQFKKILRIAVLNASSLDEGFLQLIEQANKATREGLLIEFVVLGNTMNNNKLQHLSNVYLVGEVKKDQIQQVLRLYNCCAIANFSPRADIRHDVTQTAQQYKLPLIFDCKVI